MSTLRLAIALAAGVMASESGGAAAQPVVSPSQVEEAEAREAAARAAKPTKPASAAKSSKPTSAAKTAKSTRAAKSTKPAKSTATKATKSTKSAKSTKSTRSTAKAAKPTKPGKRAAARRGAAGRTAKAPQAASRGAEGRATNMPRGFTWPPSPAMLAAQRSCEAELDALGVTWKRAEPEGRMVGPIEVPDGLLGGIQYTSAWRRPPHKLDCHLARALAQLGGELRALGVREVRWGSIYRWSNVRTQGTERPILSRHALGLAMDIVELVDAQGRVANVKRDYPAGDPLLLGFEQLVNDSGKFRIVLTPRNDPQSHDDHFHVEANPDFAP